MDKFLTFGTDFTDLLHIVLGAIIDGMRDSALTDRLVLAGGCRAEHGHILHRLAQLSGGDAHAACRETGRVINSQKFRDLSWSRRLTQVHIYLVVPGDTHPSRAVADGTSGISISCIFCGR